MQEEAVKEYLAQSKVEDEQAKGAKKRPFYTTVLKCFCTFEKAKDIEPTMKYDNPDNMAGD